MLSAYDMPFFNRSSGELSAYALATRRLVLTWPMLKPGRNHLIVWPVRRICLRACYEISGTEPAYDSTRWTMVPYATVCMQNSIVGSFPLSPYGMTGTDTGYRTMHELRHVCY